MRGKKKSYIMIHPNKREHLIDIEILMTTPPRNIGVSLASLGLGEGWFLTSLGLAISIGPIGMAYLATHLPYKINQNVGKLYHTSVLGDMKNSHFEDDLGESDYHYCWNLAIHSPEKAPRNRQGPKKSEFIFQPLLFSNHKRQHFKLETNVPPSETAGLTKGNQ